VVELTLYMKPGCHLCQEAEALLDRLGIEFGFTIRQVDITQEPALHEAYGYCIPVVELEGRPLLAAPFGEATARKTLAQHLPTRQAGLPGGGRGLR
jgi:glutaredoxin